MHRSASANTSRVVLPNKSAAENSPVWVTFAKNYTVPSCFQEMIQPSFKLKYIFMPCFKGILSCGDLDEDYSRVC